MQISNGQTIIKDIRYGEVPVKKVCYRDEVWIPPYLRNENLFSLYSPWAVRASCTMTSGAFASSGGQRLTFWFPCERNTTYEITCNQWGDRLGIYGTTTLYSTPPQTWGGGTSYRAATQAPSEKTVRFTTNSTDRMAYVYLAVNVRPVDLMIRKVAY